MPETIRLGVQSPYLFGEHSRILPRVTRLDRAGNDELGNVDALGAEFVVQHLGVGVLAGEGDRSSGDSPGRPYRAPTVDEQDGSAAEAPHALQDVL